MAAVGHFVTKPSWSGHNGASLSASLNLASPDEIKQLFLSYQAAGVRFHQTLKKEPWGARTFVVSDLDGNLILFAGPAD
jgi:uncharacterized glyoxalase superfamily protein PhnB